MSLHSSLQVGVLLGGCSSEREISLKTGQAIAQALAETGFCVEKIDVQSENPIHVTEQIRPYNIDVAFIALHGAFGEDGRIQSILESLDIAYTGSGPKASELAFNKKQTQNFLKNHGVTIPSYVIVTEQDFLRDKGLILESIKLPAVVKPTCEGSSIGVSIVRSEDKLEEALINALQFNQEVIIEQFILGREMTVGIIDQHALPIVEIVPRHDFFDFEAKYQKGMTDYVVPAEVSAERTEKIQTQAKKVHDLIGCVDLSRVDFIVTDDAAYVLEINTVPGFTETSLVPKAAEHAGITFNQLCTQLVDLAYARKEKKESTSSSH